VWKAIVDHKLMRGPTEKLEADYYNKLLANCNPTRQLTAAAKQVRDFSDKLFTFSKFSVPFKNIPWFFFGRPVSLEFYFVEFPDHFALHIFNNFEEKHF
jgi:hypothetical protein